MNRKTKAKITNSSISGRTLTVNIEMKIPIDKWDKPEDALYRLKRNLKWMPNHVVNWADFDWCYTVDMFAESLVKLGEGLLRWNNCKNSVKDGRRALFAGKRLKKAADNLFPGTDDKSMKNHMSRFEFNHVKIPNGMVRMEHKYLLDNAMGMDREEYEDKMYQVIAKRVKAESEREWKETWAYIGKYMRHWWD